MTSRYLRGPTDAALPAVLRIYHAAFTEETREPDERLVLELQEAFRLPFRFLVVEAPEVVAFARFCRVPDEEFGFLLHIAVDEAHRGEGIGSFLLAEVIQAVDPLPILAEIDHEGPVRRWYDREGFTVLTATYTQPAIRPDTGPVPFLLCSSRPGLNRVDTIERFYRAVWELGPEHPYVRAACRGAL